MLRSSRRRFLLGSLALAGAGLLAGCTSLPPFGQAPAKIRRIGYLAEAPSAQSNAFLEGMRELGYLEGQNLSIEYRWSEGQYLYASHAAELVALGVECIVASGLSANVLAKPLNTTIPMVAILQNRDAVETGLVTNIARPEGNITGLAGASGLQLQAKTLGLLKETIPDAGRMAVLTDPRQPSADVVLDGIRAAARDLGVQLGVAEVEDASGLAPAVAAISATGGRGIVIINSDVFSINRAQVASLALAHRLPAISTDTGFPRAGGLMIYGVNSIESQRHAAAYVDKILKGARPADLPMERPRKYDLVINMKTAEALGLSIPQSILAQATEVIQ